MKPENKPIEPQTFFDAIMEKFHRVAKEKNRSLQPWDDFTGSYLWERLKEEYEEAQMAAMYDWMDSGLRDELLDIAAFCMFLWLKLANE